MAAVNDDIPEGHPSQDMTGRFPADFWLRGFGFRIASRPPGGSAVWAKDGKEYLERDALTLCKFRDQRVKKARKR